MAKAKNLSSKGATEFINNPGYAVQAMNNVMGAIDL